MSSLAIGEAPPPLKVSYAVCLFLSFFFQRGINNFTETFIERLIAGISHGSVVVEKTLQRHRCLLRVSKGLVTTGGGGGWGSLKEQTSLSGLSVRRWWLLLLNLVALVLRTLTVCTLFPL